DYSKAIEIRPDDVYVCFDNRGSLYASRGEWAKATADFSQAVDLQPENPRYWYRLAMARLGSGDLRGRQELCSAMLARFGAADEEEIAYWTSWTCSMGPNAPEMA